MIINQTIHIELAPEGPKIIDGYWHEWVNGEWVNTGRKAEGDPGEDGYSVSLSKAEHTFNYDKNGNLKGLLSDGVVLVEVMKGPNALICDSLGVLSPTANDTYRVTSITQSPTSSFSYNVDRPNNVFRLIPVDMVVDEVEITFTIVARSNDNNTTFTRKIRYQKHKDGADGTDGTDGTDGADGTDGDSVVHIYKQYPTKPATPSSGVINPTGWSRNPDYILSIVSQTNWTVNGKWHQSEELTATGNSATSRITFTTHKDAQTITLELWADGHATYDYVYAGKLDTAASTSNYYNRVRGGRIIITYDVPTAGSHYIDIFWRKGISTIVGSNRGYYAIISDVKVWRSATNVIGGVAQDWSEPQQFFIDSALEERIYCLSKTTTAPAISDSDAYINDYIPLPCSLSSYRGDFTTYRAYSIGQVVRYQFEYYKVVKAITSASTRYPTDEEYFEKIPGWTDNPVGANKDYPFEFVAIRKKQSDGLWGPFVPSVWSNYGIGTNYIPMGWWNSGVTYSKTDLGIPLVKKEDGTALGYSVYTLKVSASTPGSFILSEWDLVESADFIYMQQAYIERLQAEIVTAQKINTLDLSANNITARDLNGNKLATVNEFGDGAYIQYYPSGNKNMEFGGGEIIYYNNDIGNTVKWVLGAAGYSSTYQSLDRWVSRVLTPTDANGSNVQTNNAIIGIEYKYFSPGTPSQYLSHEGLTVPADKVSEGTAPSSILIDDYIPSGWYAKPGMAFMDQDNPGYYTRELYYFGTNGKQTSSKIITWN